MRVYDSVFAIFSLVTGIIFCNGSVLRRESSIVSSTTATTEYGNQINIQSQQDFHLNDSTAVMNSLEEVKCPSSGEALFQDKDNCNKYWQCSNGDKYHMTCPSKLWFNFETNICDYMYNYPLNRKCKDEKNLNCATGKPRFSVYGDCSKYLECLSGHYVWIKSCCPNRNITTCSDCLFDGEIDACIISHHKSIALEN